jgi:diguanylate cyclase (GGDEF)-like protein
MRSMYGFKFVLTVLLPLCLASLGVSLLTVDLVDRVSRGANVEDHERTTQIVVSAFGAVEHQLANTAADNANWDDAVITSYLTLDPAWFETTWGSASEVGVNYNGIIVYDPITRTNIVAYLNGKLFDPNLPQYYGGKIDALIDALPHDTKTFETKATIVSTPDGFAIVSVAPILPISEDMQIPQAKPRYLIYTKFLNADFVKSIEEQYVLSNLTIDKVSNLKSGGTLIEDVSGVPVISVRWTDRHPGDAVRSDVTNKAMMALGFLGMVVVLIGYRCWLMIKKIAKSEELAVFDAEHDTLTGLLNRAGLHSEMARLTKSNRKAITLVYLDLDGFKDVNDSYGHEVGDQLIKEVAKGINTVVGKAGTVCRLGGDEFVVVLEGAVAETSAAIISRKIIQFLGVVFDFDGRQASVGASIGISSNPDGKLDANELLRQADVAMYQAKANGKNTTVHYSPKFDFARDQDNLIAQKLRQALDNTTLGVEFQPIVDARTQKIIAVEALARWPANEENRIAPDKFVAVAEAHGIIDALGDYILRTACKTACSWPNLRLTVNVSPLQLRNPNFVKQTMATILSTGFELRRVELEITEGMLVEDIPATKRIFDELRSVGIQIALDDFGTGFTSIAYLRQFDFDRIKLDKSLIQRILSGTAEQNIVQGTMLMASGLAATVTAEGIELEEQMHLLRLSGCDEMQGYYFHKPMIAEKLTAILSGSQAGQGRLTA